MFLSVSNQSLQHSIIDGEGGNETVQPLFCKGSGVCCFAQVAENVLRYVLPERQVVFIQAEGVNGHEYIGHDATTAVDDPPVVGIVFGGVLYQHIPGSFHFSGLITIVHFVLVSLRVIVGLLDGTARGCVVAGNGKAQSSSIAEFVLFLHQPLPKGTPANNYAPVVVLNRPRYDLTGRSGALINQHNDVLHIEEVAPGGRILAAADGIPFGVDQKLVFFLEQLTEHIGGLLKVAPGIVPEVEHEIFHALIFHQLFQCFHKFFIGRCAEAVDLNVTGIGVQHVGHVHAIHRDFIPGHRKLPQLGFLAAQDTDLHVCPLFAPQHFDDIIGVHAYPGDGGVSNLHNAVAG